MGRSESVAVIPGSAAFDRAGHGSRALRVGSSPARTRLIGNAARRSCIEGRAVGEGHQQVEGRSGHFLAHVVGAAGPNRAVAGEVPDPS